MSSILDANAFDNRVLDPIRKFTGRQQIKVPSRVSWTLSRCPDGGRELRAGVSAAQLATSIQSDEAAAASFLVCCAYWLELATPEAGPVTCRLEISPTGLPVKGPARLHWRRSLLVLDLLERLLPGRFACIYPDGGRWSWPANPVMNAELCDRDDWRDDGGAEHGLEVQLTQDAGLLDAFCKEIEPIERFQRQLPVGLFDGEVAAGCSWLPGGKCQVDLWTTSPDGRVMHLFELKATGNLKVGMLPEALSYLALLHHVRAGLPGGGKIRVTGAGGLAAQRAERIVCWLMAPDIHPLLLGKGHAPLEWLQPALLQEQMEVRILPFDLNRPLGDRLVGWRSKERWPLPR